MVKKLVRVLPPYTPPHHTYPPKYRLSLRRWVLPPGLAFPPLFVPVGVSPLFALSSGGWEVGWREGRLGEDRSRSRRRMQVGVGERLRRRYAEREGERFEVGVG